MQAVTTEPTSLTTALQAHIAQAIDRAGGWIGFDRFMELALYTPGLGYYANERPKFGTLPQSGSDFVTAPEMTPLFGQTGSLRARQQALLTAHEGKVHWVDALPDTFAGVIVGNEVLDAMPVKLLARHGGALDGVWHERGVAVQEGVFAWADRPTALRPPVEIEGPHDYLTEIHPQAEAFIRTLGDRLVRGAAFFMDYGFGESEYYHPQRHMGTVMCHRAHQSDPNPLVDVGLKDITVHVNFTGVALAAQGGHGLAHQVHGAKRMVEARVEGPGIHQVAQPELLDVAQPLEPRVIDQPQHQRVGHGDEPVDGVVEDLAGVGHADRQAWRGLQGFRPNAGRRARKRPIFTHRK